METRECPGCAMEVDADAEACPICGYEFPRQPLHLKIMVWVMMALLLAWLLL